MSEYVRDRKNDEQMAGEMGMNMVPSITHHLLPSTSPAHASMSRDEKLAQWRLINQPLESVASNPY